MSTQQGSRNGNVVDLDARRRHRLEDSITEMLDELERNAQTYPPGSPGRLEIEAFLARQAEHRR
jgi:hypothetical protein